jgi:hypothetical protein
MCSLFFAAMTREDKDPMPGKMQRKHEDALAGLQAQPRISSEAVRSGFYPHLPVESRSSFTAVLQHLDDSRVDRRRFFTI